jgi:Matrixin/FG-GAP-like repeat
MVKVLTLVRPLSKSPMFSPKRFQMTRIVCHQARFKFAVVFIVAATAVVTRDVSGYALEGPKWLSSPVMQLSLGNAGHVLIDGNTSWNYAAAPALAIWNQIIARIQLGRVLNSTVQSAQQDGFNSMAFSSTVFGQNFGPNTYAVTTYWYSGTAIAEADILFNNAKPWDSYRGALRFGANGLIGDIQRVALHELGHAIGLDHPDDVGQNVAAIMNSLISDRYTLAPDDIAGAQSLYGARITGTASNILWQNSSTGARQIWVMNGTVHAATANLGTLSTQWNIVASADFSGDGKVDIVWENSSTGQCVVWFMNGSTFISAANLATVPHPWEIATAADFNGNGRADLLLENMTTGQRVIWFMNGTTRTSSWSLGLVGTAWKITGSGDFNGDGKADILWQNNAAGQRAIWLMNGTQYVGSASLGAVPIQWNMVGTGEFNGDGKRDILWQNNTTGQRTIWLMNGTTLIGNVSLGNIPTQWNIRNY